MPSVELPTRPPEQDELDALIEESRRRARRRRFGYLALALGLLALGGGLYLLFGGGGSGSGGRSTGSRPLPSAAADGLRVKLQPGWHAAKKILVPQLTNPRERMSLGTFGMRSGGNCDIAPSRAYSDMGPTDGLITLLERAGPAAKYPPRPNEIRLDPKPRSFECAPADLNTQMLAFRDHGRVIHAFVALGARGPQKEAESILNSLGVGPRSSR